MAKNLPLTIRRLAPSAKFLVLSKDLSFAASINFSEALRNARKIGAIIRWSETDTRESELRFEIDSDIGFDPVERTPTLPSERRIDVRRAVLYRSDMLQELHSSSVFDLNQITEPISLAKIEDVPDNIDGLSQFSGAKPITTYYLGCWIHTNPKTYEYERGGGLLVVQDIIIGYTRKVIGS